MTQTDMASNSNIDRNDKTEDHHKISDEDDQNLLSQWREEVKIRKLKHQSSFCDFEGCWQRHLWLAAQCHHPGTKHEYDMDEPDYWSDEISEARSRQIEKNRIEIIEKSKTGQECNQQSDIKTN